VFVAFAWMLGVKCGSWRKVGDIEDLQGALKDSEEGN
jgi:hypothetical protein